MKKFIFPLLSDLFAIFFISFILCFLIINYFIHGAYAHLLAFLLGTIISLLVGKRIYAKYQHKFSDSVFNKKYKESIMQLNFNTRQKNDALFFKAYKIENPDVIKNSTHLFLPSKNTLVFTRFDFENIVRGDIVKIFNQLKKDQVAIIYAEKFSPEVSEFASQFNNRIFLREGKDAFSLLEKTNNLPELSFTLIDSASKKKFSIHNVFLRKRAKTFLGFGVTFLIMSYFVPLKLYYVICGVIMLTISAICIVFGRTYSAKDDHVVSSN